MLTLLIFDTGTWTWTLGELTIIHYTYIALHLRFGVLEYLYIIQAWNNARNQKMRRVFGIRRIEESFFGIKRILLRSIALVGIER